MLLFICSSAPKSLLFLEFDRIITVLFFTTSSTIDYFYKFCGLLMIYCNNFSSIVLLGKQLMIVDLL
jgi:hypothetical protein